MRLVSSPAPSNSSASDAPSPNSLHAQVKGVPLSVVFADADAIKDALAGAETIDLAPPYHLNDADAYLILPDDVGVEIIDIMRDGDDELLAESLRDGLVAIGTVERVGKGRVVMAIDDFLPAAEALADVPYASEIRASSGDLLAALNEIQAAHVTMNNQLVDAEGLQAIAENREFLGVSWRVDEDDRARLAGVEPTYVWSVRRPDRSVGIELVLFHEYEEIVAVLRPARIVL